MIRLTLVCSVFLASSFASAEERDLLNICGGGTVVELVEYHLLHPDCISKSNEKDEALVATAMSRRDPTIVLYLLKHGADPHLLDSEGRSALDYAIRSKREELIELVAPYSSILDLPAFAELNRLDWAIRAFAEEKDVGVIKQAIARFRKHDLTLPSWDAVARAMETSMENPEKLSHFIANLSVPLSPGLKPTFFAQAPPEMAKMLSEAERQSLARLAVKRHIRALYEVVNRAGFKHDAAFKQFAAEAFDSGNETSKVMLIDYGLVGQEALNEAVLEFADHGSTDEMMRAIRAGGKINAIDEDGQTPIMRAVHGGRYDVIVLLLEADADVNVKDHRDHTLYDYAKKYDLPPLLVEKIFLKMKTSGGKAADEKVPQHQKD